MVFGQADALTINHLPADSVVSNQIKQTNNYYNNNYSGSTDTIGAISKMQKLQDGVCMRGTKMMLITKGVTGTLHRDLKLKNGTKVYSNGTFVLLNGTRIAFKNGDEMNMDGDLVQLK